MRAVVYDPDGRIYRIQTSSLPDPAEATAYLISEMTRKGLSPYILTDQPIDPDAHWISGGALAARPEVAARTPGALPWTIPQSEGETVSVRNEGGDIVESDDHTDPVTITDAGTYAITVSAAFPAITWRGSVDLA